MGHVTLDDVQIAQLRVAQAQMRKASIMVDVLLKTYKPPLPTKPNDELPW